FTPDGVAYLKRQREEFGITSKAEHAAQRRTIAAVFECSEASVKNWFNNAKPASQRSTNPVTHAVNADADSQPARPILSEQPQTQSAVNRQGTLDVASAIAATRRRTQTVYQIFLREEARGVFQNLTLPEHVANLDGQLRTQAILGIASKIIASKYHNLSNEERAVYEVKAKEANARPLQLVSDLNIDEKLELCNKTLAQVGKAFEVLEALGWSYIFAGVNEETNASFKEVKGTPTRLVDSKYLKSRMDVVTQLQASRILAKPYPSIAKSVGKNKSVLQSRMEHLALESLNKCLSALRLECFSTFPWGQVQSKQVLNQSFHFLHWPSNIPMTRNMTIENCEIIIRMFERQQIQARVGVDQAGGTEIPEPSFGDENQQVLGRGVGFEFDLEDSHFLELLNN
ncbi:hypothetical protein HDU80_009643, partial [Chytriomyces hyalinus]